MNRRHIAGAVLIFTLFAAPLLAQGFDYEQLGITIKADPAAIPAGSKGSIVITLDIPFGYSVTDLEGVFEMKPMADIPGISFGALIKPGPSKIDEVGGHFQGITEFKLPYTVAANATAGARTLVIGFTLQACDDQSGQCYLPTSPDEVQRRVSFEITAAPKPLVQTQTAQSDQPVSSETVNESPAKDEPTQEATEPEPDVDDVAVGQKATEQPATEQAVAATAPQPGQDLESIFKGSLEGGNFWFAILLAIGAGIITSLTPCVYPMIPITISYVSGKAQGQKRNGFFISLVLVLGICITYSVLGLVAAMTGSTFGSYINHPIVQGVIFVVLVAMGFSMLGLFEIAMPSGLTQKMATQKSGYFGALGVGLTIGFVAAPCVAPILVIMLTWIATTQNLFLGFILMFAYAIGMGLLFIVVGTFSNAVLPRSGMWMVWLKKIFAFVFFIMAAIYAQGLLESVYAGLSFYIIGALLVLLGVVLGAFNPTSKDSGWWEMIGKALGLLAVVTGLIFFAGQLIHPMLPATGSVQGGATAEKTDVAEPNWTTDFEAGLAEAARSGKPLLVDVWATWCIACHELDELTFSDPRIITELNERFILVKVDGTSEADPKYRAVKEHFAAKGYPIVGLPAVFIHDSRGNIVSVINQFQTAEVVLPKLQAAR